MSRRKSILCHYQNKMGLYVTSLFCYVFLISSVASLESNSDAILDRETEGEREREN